jgi:murein DD-endopeptidase MepM/ murein hydrolase activator NlpD
MRKEKFVYNTQTLRYEKVVEPLKIKIFRVLGFVCGVIVSSIIIISLAFYHFPSPKEEALMREITQLKTQYSSINQDIDILSKVLTNIQDRDANVHRIIFGMDPIDESVWNGGVGGHSKYNTSLTKFKSTGDLLVESREKLDKLKRQLAIQSKSLDEVEDLASKREEMMASVPAIKPIRSDHIQKNIGSLSGFGMRMHPVFKRRKMHTGIDFTCPLGTPIHASGDGKITAIEYMKSGYGTHVVIDHGFGYSSLYAHMSEVDVTLGQKVKRGQVIGKVGSTGTSTAPHLHYEVIHKNKKVNPIHYCMDGLSDMEYQQLVNMASISNQSFD